MSGECSTNYVISLASFNANLYFRLILYYPVSALVTLFANILQNPNEPRARSDVKLMDVVVNFLSNLVSDESNGNIKRMLTLCGEFERIAKVVIDKAEKESHSRKKRKAAPDQNARQQQDRKDNSAPNSAPTASSGAAGAPPTTTTAYSPPLANVNSDPIVSGSNPVDLSGHVHGLPDLGQNIIPDMLSPTNMGNPNLADQTQFTTTDSTPSSLSAFQQPFVPQDLWQIPMSLEWDWADMPTSFPVFDNGMNSGGPPHTDP